MIQAPPAQTQSILGSWTCRQDHRFGARNVIEHWEFTANGLLRWRYATYRPTYRYKFDDRTLTIYGAHLPEVLKWSITFTAPNAYVATPIQGEIAGESCIRAISGNV